MKRIITLFLLTLLLGLWLCGCSENGTQSTSTDSTNLVDEFGGYTTNSESPAFGEADLLDEEDDTEEIINDPILTSPEVASLTDDPESGLFHLRIIWGQLHYDSTVTELTDWSGSLTITRGAAIIRRLIRFERGQDYLLERIDRTTIEWVSATTVHNDGIAVDFFIPPPIDAIAPEPITITFSTGPYTRTFTLDELAALDTVIELENTAIVFHALQIHRTPCPGGFLAGRWGFDEDGKGIFRGRWMGYRGEITGWLKGHYGVNSEGHNRFFGKWIDSNGNFKGFLRGTYGQINTDRHARDNIGAFAGKIYNANRKEIGKLAGRYCSAPDKNGGFFQGRWILPCQRITDRSLEFDNGFNAMD